jgi:surfactin synthase thioesterase subunit
VVHSQVHGGLPAGGAAEVKVNTAASALRFRRNPQARLRLFCFPSAGSGVSLLHSWFKDMPLDYEVCAIQPPGREDRHLEPPFRRMAPLVAMAADALAPVLELPYALFGHSLGALTAFEVARELRRRGLPAPVRLFVSSRIAPQLAPRFGSIHHLPESEFIKELAVRYGPIPSLILSDPELMALFFPVLRSDIEVLETYTYRAEEPLDMPISVLSGASDPMVDEAGMHAWAEQTSSTTTVRILAGDHFFPKAARETFLNAISGDLSASAGLSN